MDSLYNYTCLEAAFPDDGSAAKQVEGCSNNGTIDNITLQTQTSLQIRSEDPK